MWKEKPREKKPKTTPYPNLTHALSPAPHTLACLPLLTRPHPQQVREVCEMVTLRSAKLVASALDALLTHTGWKARAAEQPEDVTIAFDGGVYEKFSVYRTMLDRAMRELLGGCGLRT